MESNAVVAKELGIARYERIKEHDWSAGEKYWKETNEFWSVVSTWTRILEENDTVTNEERWLFRPTLSSYVYICN